MKVYDKEIYTKQESIKTTAIMILVFLIGFVAGYLANSFSNTNSIKNEIKELVIPSVKESTGEDETENVISSSSNVLQEETVNSLSDE